jgi:hypothetical protein
MTAAVLGATLAAALLAFTAFWAASLPRRDAGIVDFYWGPGFVVIGWLAAAIAGRFDAGSLLFLSLLTLWGVRLGWYMTARHGGAEDARYAAMRERHGEAFGRKSLWMVFWLQGVIQWIASSPALVVALSAAAAPGLLAWLGAAIFVLGFSIEIAADRAHDRAAWRRPPSELHRRDHPAMGARHRRLRRLRQSAGVRWPGADAWAHREALGRADAGGAFRRAAGLCRMEGRDGRAVAAAQALSLRTVSTSAARCSGISTPRGDMTCRSRK